MRKILLFVSLSIFAATSAFAQRGGDEGAIVGGSSVSINSYPYQVSIQTTSGYHFCGGTIIDDEWILTAAHCIDGTSASSIRVMAGASRISQSSSGQIRNVSAIYEYPGYSTPSAGKDAALLKLSSPLSLNGTTVKAIPYATAADASAGYTNAGVMATVSGWGTLSSGGSSPDQLQAVQVPIVTNAYANSQYPQNITSDQLGAGYTTGGKDACQGDSGGPLVVSKGSGVIVAGIVSWGYGCADPDYVGMYGRVSSFAPWIDSYVSGNTGGGGDPTYCASKSNNSSYEWIQRVDFANLWTANSGNNGGYVSYDASAWTIQNNGTSYPISVDVAFSGTSYTEYYRVWIDFNRDGDFNDSGEQILSKSSSSSAGVSGTFTVPVNVASGKTKMRVAMKYGGYPTSCETFTYGEVEDYTINIQNINTARVGTGEGTSSKEVVGLDNTAEITFDMFPNPASTSATMVYHAGHEVKDIKISLIDITGKVITVTDYAQRSGMIEHAFDVQNLDNGIYLVSVESGDTKKVKRLVVSK